MSIIGEGINTGETDTLLAQEKKTSVKGLQMVETEKEISYSSPWLKVSFPRDDPACRF